MSPEIFHDRSLIIVGGQDAPSFLQRIITTDIHKILEQETLPGALLSPQGKILFDFLIAKKEDSCFLLDIRTDYCSDFISKLLFYRMRANVEIKECKEKKIQVFQQENSPCFGKDSYIFRDMRFGNVPVWRLYSPEENILSNSLSLKEWISLRIKYGIAETGFEFNSGENFPHDIALDRKGGLKVSNGCYIGQEVVSRMHHRATVRRDLFVVTGKENLPPSGTPVLAELKPIGKLGSVLDNRALSIMRTDHVKNVTDAQHKVTASGIVVTLSLPLSCL